mmetsp:Transcript_5703/g.6228  ORF Transcript_5703/g.6228 Transcript_5703/m.6228 type:complete len:158 (-) Transcript_5703:840-1313(-)
MKTTTARKTRRRNKIKHNCEETVKSLVLSSGHRKCYKGSRHSVKIKGKRLNSFLNMNSEIISNRKQVRVCHTLMLADRAMPPIEDDVDGAIEFIDETKLEYELAVSLLVSLLSPKYLQLSHLIYLSAETRNNFLLYITESGGTTLLSSLTDMTFSST